MSICDPSKREMFLMVLFGYYLEGTVYKKFIKEIDLNGDEKVLEFGCGPGALTKRLAPALNKGGNLTALDISPKWIEILKRRNKKFDNIKTMSGDILEMDLFSGKFDTIVVHYMLHDIDKELRPPIVEALTKTIKSGGHFYIKEPIKDSHGMPVSEIQELLGNNGFKLIRDLENKKNYFADYLKE